jgi:hypothetical protein
MQQQFSPVDSLDVVSPIEAPVSGPLVLDLALQSLVSGGYSPKGGWAQPLVGQDAPAEGGW